MSYGNGQEDGGDRSFRLDDSSARSGEQDNLGAPAVVSAGWRPIETAPEDGRCLLAINTDDGYEFGVLLRDAKGRWIHDGEPTFCHGYYYEPTHWMPLPEAPTAAPARPPADRSAGTTPPIGDRCHFALTAALAENERLREALTLMLPLARNWNGQRWSQNTSEAITKAEAALKGPQQ
jgi:hypothetical protein